MPGKDEEYVDGDELDPAEVIGPPRGAIERAQEILRRIEGTESEASPKDVVTLFEAVADLRFTDWENVDILWTPERLRRVGAASRDLYARLVALVGRHPGVFAERLESGIRDLVAKISAGLRRHERVRMTHSRPWEYNSSYEFLGDVVFPLDTLGYVLEMMRAVRIEPREPTANLVGNLDRTLRLALPGIAEEYRRGGDSIDPVSPDAFPESFWWRRLPGAEPIL